MARLPEGHVGEDRNTRKCALCRGTIDLDCEDAEYNPDWGWMHQACANIEENSALD